MLDHHSQWKVELQTLLDGDATVELQAVSSVHADFLSSHFLEWKLAQGSWL